MVTDRLYTGQRQETFGLYDYRARYYHPALGRFISADPLVPEPGNPQALNRYAYVRNNPLKYTDPSGHAICLDEECRQLVHPITLKPIGGWDRRPPPPQAEMHLSLQDAVNFAFIGPPEIYDTLATVGDVLQVLIDAYCVGVVWTWTIVGGVAGIPGSEFAVPVTGAAGWAWGELEVQPAMKLNDVVGIVSSTANTIGDVKAGRTNVELDIQILPQAALLEGRVQVAPTTANDWLFTLVSLHPLADIAEVSLVLDVAGLLQDFDVVGPWPVRQTIRAESRLEIPLR